MISWLIAFGILAAWQTSAQITMREAGVQDELFGALKVLDLSIAISAEGIESLKASPKQYVSASVTESGQTYGNVAVRLKGLGSFRPITDKASFSIKFDEYVPDARFHGHSRILLENSTQDRTFLRRRLCSELFLQAGIPAARVVFARVRLNDRYLGLYTLSEAMNRPFLARHFASDTGNLYEGGDGDISLEMEQDAGDRASERQEIRALLAACREPDLALRWKRLQSVLDVNRFIDFVALEVLITHHDGYSMDLNNYRIYHDPTRRRIIFIPHGMDLVFNRPTWPLEPEWKGIVAEAVLSTPEGRERHAKRLAELAQVVYGGETLLRRIDELVRFLRPAVSYENRERESFEISVNQLKEIIQRRTRFVFDHPLVKQANRSSARE